MLKNNFLTNTSLVQRLLRWFLAVSLLPLIIVGYVTYIKAEQTLIKKIFENLTVIADQKVRTFSNYFLETEWDATTLSQIPTITGSLEKFVSAFQKGGVESEEYQALDKELRPILTNLFESEHEYYDLFLISFAGDIVFTIKLEDDFGTNLKTGSYKNSELAKAFDMASRMLATELSDFKYYSPSDEPAAFVASPIFIKGRMEGVVALQISTKELYEHINDFTGLGKTGEVVVGANMGDKILFVNPLRHDTEAAFKREVAMAPQQPLPLHKALQGKRGSGISIDYRGKEVLAVWRYSPHLRWGVVVKIDTEEAFSPIYRLRNWFLAIGAMSAFGVILAAFFVSRSISQPIDNLVEGTRRFRQRDFSGTVSETGPEEIVTLGKAFNAMAAELKKSYNLLEEQLKQLSVNNQALQREILERKQAQVQTKRQIRVLNAVNKVLRERILCDTEEELGKLCLSIAEELSGSKFGYIGEINPSGLFDTIAISNPGMKECTLPEGKATLVIKNMKIRGVDKGIMSDGKSRIVNGEEAIKNHPDHVEVPEGHPPVTAFLGVPFLKEGKVVGMIGLANKEGGYILEDQENIEALSVAMIEAIKSKRADEKIKKMQDELIRNEKLAAVGKLASIIGHDLRNPLGVISNSIYYLNMKLKGVDEKVNKHLGILNREIAHSDNIVSDLLDFSKTKSVSLNRCNINEVVKSFLVDRIVPETITVETQLYESLPKINLDEDRILRVFLNLFSNAVQAMPEGGRLEIKTRKAESFIEVIFQDSGLGVTQENIQKIFDPFFTTKAKGIGLGLAIIKEIIQGHQGEIKVENATEKGAIFTIKLPLDE